MAARTAKFDIRNTTELTMTKASSHFAWGEWSSGQVPPETIQEQASWRAESNGVFTGTEGSVTYHIEGGGSLVFSWNVPFVLWGRENDMSVKCDPGFRADLENYDRKGNDPVARITISRQEA